jgi:hypothetical protein
MGDLLEMLKAAKRSTIEPWYLCSFTIKTYCTIYNNVVPFFSNNINNTLSQYEMYGITTSISSFVKKISKVVICYYNGKVKESQEAFLHLYLIAQNTKIKIFNKLRPAIIR